MMNKSIAFARSVRAFVHRCGLAAGVDLARPDLEDEAGRAAARSFGHVPIDPEALLVLATRWAPPEELAAFERWAGAHERLLAKRRLGSLAAAEDREPIRCLRSTPAGRRPLALRRPSNVWARARVAFGVGARAAVVTAVCATPRWDQPVWRIAADSGISERGIRTAVSDLGSLGFVTVSKRRGTTAKFAPPLDVVRAPGPQLHGRTWTDLLSFLRIAEREFTRADEDPVGLDDPDGPLGARRRLRRAASEARIQAVAVMADPSSAFNEPDPMGQPLLAVRRFLELLDGW